MEHTPCWIWYPGDFELRHSLKLHARHQERDYCRLAIWPVYDCWRSVRFFRLAELIVPEGLTVRARGKGNVGVDGRLYPFGKSLCHAWGAGPIDLIGRYVAGFRAESPGCRAFALEPRPSGLTALDTVIPLPDGGQVRLCWNERELRILTDRSGGALIWQGRRIPLERGQELRVSR